MINQEGSGTGAKKMKQGKKGEKYVPSFISCFVSGMVSIKKGFQASFICRMVGGGGERGTFKGIYYFSVLGQQGLAPNS
jgi:hypothetical protein